MVNRYLPGQGGLTPGGRYNLEWHGRPAMACAGASTPRELSGRYPRMRRCERSSLLVRRALLFANRAGDAPRSEYYAQFLPTKSWTFTSVSIPVLPSEARLTWDCH